MTPGKTGRLLEVVWLALAIISFLAGIYNWFRTGPGEGAVFFIMTFLAVMMFLYRRKLRKPNNNQHLK